MLQKQKETWYFYYYVKRCSCNSQFFWFLQFTVTVPYTLMLAPLVNMIKEVCEILCLTS